MDRIGPYRIMRLLGKGGMGAVYEAEHDATQRRVAIKVILPERAHDREAVQRFFNEARAVTQIDHPSLVQVYDFGHAENGMAYLVMEYLAGETLTAQLQTLQSIGQRLLLRGVLRIAIEVADVLAAAHAQGIVHRDLKPDNIMLLTDAKAPDGQRVKLLDFGIAKLVQNSGKKTNTHSLLGTPRYMSPEQCRGAGNVDQKTDVYALGVILFEMLAGRLPFIGEGDGDYIAQHIVAEPPPLASMAAHAPAALVGLVHRLLLKDKTQRPTMIEVRTLLQEQMTIVRQDKSAQAKGPPLDQMTMRMVLPSASPSTLGSSSAQAIGGPLRRFTGPRRLAVLGGGCALIGLGIYVAAARFGSDDAMKSARTATVMATESARKPDVRPTTPAPIVSVAEAPAPTKSSTPVKAPAPAAPEKEKPAPAAPPTVIQKPKAPEVPRKTLETALADANSQYESGQYSRAIKSSYALFRDYPQATKATSKPGLRAWLIIGLSSCMTNNLAAVNAAYQHLDLEKRKALAYGCHHAGIFLSNGKFSAGQ